MSKEKKYGAFDGQEIINEYSRRFTQAVGANEVMVNFEISLKAFKKLESGMDDYSKFIALLKQSLENEFAPLEVSIAEGVEAGLLKMQADDMHL